MGRCKRSDVVAVEPSNRILHGVVVRRAGVRFVPDHHRRPLPIAHCRRNRVGQQIDVEVFARQKKRIEGADPADPSIWPTHGHGRPTDMAGPRIWRAHGYGGPMVIADLLADKLVQLKPRRNGRCRIKESISRGSVTPASHASRRWQRTSTAGQSSSLQHRPGRHTDVLDMSAYGTYDIGCIPWKRQPLEHTTGH